MLEIGKLKIGTRCIMAPLAGISDLPFRLLIRSLGCRFAFTEMISASALVYENRKTGRMLSITPDDRPLGIQLVEHDPEVLRRAVDLIAESGFELIDFNAACPVTKVVRKGEGSALMREPIKLRELLKILVERSGTSVTVKIRSGWDRDSVNAREVAMYAQDAGIHGLTIHGRTRDQEYRGRVDYEIIADVKRALSIPVMGSGDVFSPELVKRMMDETGCDGVAVARGALGNPWIFRDSESYLSTGFVPMRPGRAEVISVMRRHFEDLIDFYGEGGATRKFRKFFSWYTKGMVDVKPLRERAFKAATKESMLELIRELT